MPQELIPADPRLQNLPLPTNSVISTTEDMAPPPVEDWMDFNTVKVKLNRLVDNFSPQIQKAKLNRDERYKDLNLKALRAAGTLKQDELMIPIRAIDNNIRREHPLYVNYFRQSRRLMIFDAIKKKDFNSEEIEAEFTRGMTYSGWEIPLFKVVDGAATHGWDAVEVVLDMTKPFHVGIEHIGNDMLIFPTTSKNIQFNECIIRKYVVYPKQLKNLAGKYDFNMVEVDRILAECAKEEVEKTICIYKTFYKVDGVVWVAWFEMKGSDWLKMPAKLFLGKKQTVTITETVLDPMTQQPMIDPMTGLPKSMVRNELVDQEEYMYPVFLLPYYETEQSLIFDHVGRVFLDRHKQEAKTANISQFLTGCQRAAQIYPRLREPTDRNAKELENVKIKAGSIPPIPIEFFQLEYPDQTMLNLQNYLDVMDSNEAGQINYAVQNRKDSRKTATEIQAAQQENSQLNSVQVVLFSTFLREVYTFVWGIVKSKAINNEITFLWVDPIQSNDIEKIDLDFDLRAAGDVDVIKRNEQLAQYKEFWEIVSQTPIALTFLADMLRLAFPIDGKGEVYANQLSLGDPTVLIQQMLQIIQTTIDPEDVMSLTPEAQMNLQNVIMQAQNLVARAANPTGASPAGAQAAPEQETEQPMTQ